MIVDLFESAECNSELHFFCLQVEIPFLSKFGPKNQNVSLSSNLVPRLIWILEFNGDVNFFFFFWLEIPFLGKLYPKNQNCQFEVKFGT